ncbi:MAG TPA: FHA domain-containing protein [Myxococcales bacterium]|nr:FHA domain-containing protein [Myxococcales bacterium]
MPFRPTPAPLGGLTVGELFSLAAKSLADAEKRLGSSLALLPLEPWVFPNEEHTRDTTLAGRSPLVPTTLGKQAPALEAWPYPVPALATVELGRSRQVAIRIDQPTISRVHAELARVARGFALRDRGSYNGTMLNGRVLDPGEAPELADGDVITLGETQLLYGSLSHLAKIAPSHKKR